MSGPGWAFKLVDSRAAQYTAIKVPTFTDPRERGPGAVISVGDRAIQRECWLVLGRVVLLFVDRAERVIYHDGLTEQEQMGVVEALDRAPGPEAPFSVAGFSAVLAAMTS